MEMDRSKYYIALQIWQVNVPRLKWKRILGPCELNEVLAKFGLPRLWY